MANLKLAISNKRSPSQTNCQQRHSSHVTQMPQPAIRVNEVTASSLHVLLGCATPISTYVMAHLASRLLYF